MTEKRHQKLAPAIRHADLSTYKRFGDEGEVDVGLIAWGSTFGEALEAMLQARSEGIRCAAMKVVMLSPLPVDAIRQLLRRLPRGAGARAQLPGPVRPSADRRDRLRGAALQPGVRPADAGRGHPGRDPPSGEGRSRPSGGSSPPETIEGSEPWLSCASRSTSRRSSRRSRAPAACRTAPRRCRPGARAAAISA